jgi:5,6-dimethylbenzimidazole synthase
MQIDDFVALAKRRRSIRRFKPDPFPDEYIDKILEAARFAPSGANSQPWEFIVVKDQGTKMKIAELFMEAWKSIYTFETQRVDDLKHQGFINPPPREGAVTLGFLTAPVVIAVCGDPRTLAGTVMSAYLTSGEGGPNAVYLKNVANATMLIHLAAASCGLGSQWLSVERSWDGPLKDLLGVPDILDLHTLVPVGYPAYEPVLPYRRDLDEIVHHENYNRSKYRTDQDIIAWLRYCRKMFRPAHKQAYPESYWKS